MKSTHDAIDVCSEAHQRDPRNANILRDRAEAYILNQEYEKGEEQARVQRFMRTVMRQPRYDQIRYSFIYLHLSVAMTLSVCFQLLRTTKRRWTLTTSRKSKKVWNERRNC